MTKRSGISTPRTNGLQLQTVILFLCVLSCHKAMAEHHLESSVMLVCTGTKTCKSLITERGFYVGSTCKLHRKMEGELSHEFKRAFVLALPDSNGNFTYVTDDYFFYAERQTTERLLRAHDATLHENPLTKQEAIALYPEPWISPTEIERQGFVEMRAATPLIYYLRGTGMMLNREDLTISYSDDYTPSFKEEAATGGVEKLERCEVVPNLESVVEVEYAHRKKIIEDFENQISNSATPSPKAKL